MGVTLTTATRNVLCNALADLSDVSGPGEIRIQTTGLGTVLAVLPLSNPAFGAAAAGVCTADSITADDSADASGTAAAFDLRDGAGLEVFRGSVGGAASGEDIELSSNVITAGDEVSLSAFTETVPAS